MWRSTLKAKPSLYIYRNSKVEKPTIDERKVHIGSENMLSKSVTYPNTADSAAWLRANVYSTNKKEEQKKNLFAEDVDRYMEDKAKQKVPQEVIEDIEKQLEKVREDAKQVPYPLTVFYPGEITETAVLNKEELTAQKTEVGNCGYQVEKEGIYKLVENEILKNQQSVIPKIASYWETKEEHIRRAVKAEFFKNTDAITVLETKLRKLRGLALSENTIFQDAESVIALEISGFTQLVSC